MANNFGRLDNLRKFLAQAFVIDVSGGGCQAAPIHGGAHVLG